MNLDGTKKGTRRILAGLGVCAAATLGGPSEASADTFTTRSTDWQAALGWCNHAGAELHTGDFNRDGREDMLCHDTNNGYKWVALANSQGRFTGTSWEGSLGWCYHSGAELHVGDVNRDGRDDMICHDTNNGYKWVSLAKGSGRFTGTDWQANMGWCNHESAQLHVGDFNRDDRDDMLCHDTSTGYKWIAYAKGNGTFSGTDWQAALGWCYHDGAELRIGDFNRDNRDDMLCHDRNNGYKWVALANAQGRFTGTSWEANLGWCHHESGQLHIGDYNGDRRDDMLCHDIDTGYKWIIYSDL